MYYFEVENIARCNRMQIDKSKISELNHIIN